MRFSRTELLLGPDATRKLKNAHVLICGVGAVGGAAAEAIARMGIGGITLIDFDTVNITNINRQIVALTSTIGAKKTFVMARRIIDINPDCDVVEMDIKITDENIGAILNDVAPKIIIDAIDDVNAKCALIKTATDRNITIVSSMGAAQKTDLSKIRTGPINKTFGDPLARVIRKKLREMNADMTKTVCVFSDEIPTTIAQNKILPSIATTTMTFGIRVADEACKRVICDNC